MHAAETARSSAEVALRSAESQFKFVCASELSLWEEVGQFKSDKTPLKKQSELEVRSGGRSRDLLYSKCKVILNLREKIWVVRAQYDK